jgi:hypothetical protein
MKKLFLILAAVIVVLTALQISAVSAQSYELNYTNFNTAGSANLVVQTLKYEPYPVNAGEWFDLWVKIQNIGQSDAPNVKLSLSLDYPFSSDEPLQIYGRISGTINAYQTSTTADASQIVTKFRVKVADNAPEGDSNLKLSINSDQSNAASVTYSLPITVGKTKTDFDVVMQGSSAQGASFAIANIGSNDATAVTVSAVPADNIIIKGAQSSIIGNLAKGDFTTITFQVSPKTLALNNSSKNFRPSNFSNAEPKNMTIKIDYTDIAGVRNSIEKVVPISLTSALSTTLNSRTAASSSYTKYLYLAAGLIIGALGLRIYQRIRKKKKI